ncbi:hypothetical protein Tco_0038524 [Tanacetum coccineum]
MKDDAQTTSGGQTVDYGASKTSDGKGSGNDGLMGGRIIIGKTDTVTSTGLATKLDGIMNDATPLFDTAAAAMEVVYPSMVDESVAKENPSLLLVTTSLESYPPLPKQVTTTTGNTPGMSSYANVTGKPSGKKVNFRTLFTPGGNGIDVVVPVESIRAIRTLGVKLHGVPVTAFSKDGLSAIATKLGQAMIKLRADMELKDNVMVAMLKITGEGHYTCAGETKNLKKTSQPPKGVDSTNKVSDSNPFKVFNLVDNDVEMDTNGGTSNLDNNGANSSGSSFWNVENSSTNTNPIMDKIRKFKNLVIDGQAILVDEVGNLLKNIEYPGDHDSEDEVASVDNEMARDLALKRTGFGTQSLLEQWRDSYGNGDYDKDLYDDDMYEG